MASDFIINIGDTVGFQSDKHKEYVEGPVLKFTHDERGNIYVRVKSKGKTYHKQIKLLILVKRNGTNLHPNKKASQ